MSATELKGIWLDLRDVSEVALTLCRGGSSHSQQPLYKRLYRQISAA